MSDRESPGMPGEVVPLTRGEEAVVVLCLLIAAIVALAVIILVEAVVVLVVKAVVSLIWS